MQVDLEGLGFDAQSDRLAEGAATLNTQGDAYDPGLTMFRAYHSAFIDDGESFTAATKMRNPVVDTALERARSSLDRGARAGTHWCDRTVELTTAADGAHRRGR